MNSCSRRVAAFVSNVVAQSTKCTSAKRKSKARSFLVARFYLSPLIIGYPHAKCFVCGRQGHLSRECDDNPNGVFPDGVLIFLFFFSLSLSHSFIGGACNLCSANDHLKNDCPLLTKKKSKKSGDKEADERTMELQAIDNVYTNPDEDVTNVALEETPPAKKKKKAPKVVKM